MDSSIRRRGATADSTTTTTSSTSSNPLKTDPVLVNLLKRLSGIKKYKTFHRWKKKFLNRLLPHLKYEKGMEPAHKACDSFSQVLNKAGKHGAKVADFIEKEGGERTTTTTSVKANLALREFCTQLQATVDQLGVWIPGNTEDEKQRGYTKFHLGASLIEQGFTQYITMHQMQDAIAEIRAKMNNNVLDKQQLELFDQYQTAVSRFCDVMADLNLYEIMKKCLEFAVPPDIEESSDEEEMIVEFTDGNKSVQLEVMPSDLVGNLKPILQEDLGIPPEQQLWKLHNKEIDNSDHLSLAKAGIKDKSKVLVEIRKIDITVETPDGKIQLPLTVEPTAEKLHSLQPHIAKKFNIEPENQKLIYNGKELPNLKQTFNQAKIPHGARLIVKPCKVPITVHTYDGKKIPLQVDPYTTTTGDIKSMIETDTKVPANNQRLFPMAKQTEEYTNNDKTLELHGIPAGADLYMEPASITLKVEMIDGSAPNFDLKVALDETTDAIQKRIATKTKLPVPEQIVKYHKTKDWPKQQMTVKQLKLQNGDVLQVKSNSICLRVEMLDGSPSFELEVKPDHNMAEIQKRIADKSKLSIEEQIATYKGNNLMPKSTVQGLKMQDGDVIQVKSNSIVIKVEMKDGPSFDLEVKPYHSMADIQKMIADKSKLPVEEQIATYKGTNLLPKSTVQGLKMQDGDTIKVKSNSINLHVEVKDGSAFDLEVKPDHSMADIQRRIADKSGLPVEEQIASYKGTNLLPKSTVEGLKMQDGDTIKVKSNSINLHVEVKDGPVFDLEVKPDYNMADIQKRIADKSGLPVEEQIATYKGTELVPKSTVQGLKMQDGDTIKVKSNSIHLHVEVKDGLPFDLEVKPDHSMAEIQKRIADKSGLSVEEQIATYKGTNLLPKSTVQGLKMQDGDTIKVKSNSINLHIEMENGSPSFDLEVKPHHTTEQIQSWIAKKSGLPVAEQIVKYKGKDLLPKATVQGMKMQDGDTVTVKSNSITLHVEMQDGNPRFDLEVKPHHTAADIQKRIAKKTGLPVAEQIAKYKGKEMLAKNSVEQMGMQDGDSIQVRPNTINIHIEMPDSRQSFDMEVKPSHSTEDIQVKIQNTTGLPAADQILKYKGRDMLPKNTVEQMGMKEQDTVQVKLAKMPVTVKSKSDNREIMKMMVDPLENLLSIKKQITAETKVAPEHQTLTLSSSAEELQGLNKTAQDLGIKPGSVLFLEGEVVVRSSGEVYIALTVQVKEAPNPEDYDEVVKRAKSFYVDRLKKVYSDSFKDLELSVHNFLWRADKPSRDYNVYIEWDLKAHFVMSGSFPTRHELCQTIVKSDLMPLLQKIMNSSEKPFNRTRGIYTKQTN